MRSSLAEHAHASMLHVLETDEEVVSLFEVITTTGQVDLATRSRALAVRADG